MIRNRKRLWALLLSAALIVTQLSALNLPDTVTAAIYHVTEDTVIPEEDDSGNWPLIGDYTFTAKLPEGYACEPLSAVNVLLGGVNLHAANNTETQGGIEIVASSNGEVTYTEGSGFTLKESGDYTISGIWAGNLDTSSKAVITVPDGVIANVTLNGVTIDVGGTTHAGTFACGGSGRHGKHHPLR